MKRLAVAAVLAILAVVLTSRGETGRAQGQPDLVPTNFTAPAAADIPAAGVRIQVSWTVTNQGPGAAGPNWTDRIWLSADQALGSGDTSVHAVFRNPGLPANDPNSDNDAYSVNAEFTLPRPAALNVSGASPTDYHLLLRTDDNGNPTSPSGGNVPESTETNNIAVQTIRLTPIFPDLVPTSFTAPAAATIPAAGARVRVSWTVANQGPDLAPCCWTDRIWLSTNQTLESGDTHLHAINRGAELPPADPTSDDDTYSVRSFDVFIPRPAALNNPATSAPARYFLLLRTDDFGNPASAGPHTVVEGSDLNNVAVAQIDLTPVFPDLTPTAFTAPAAVDVPAGGAQVRVTWTVTNQGPDVALPVWSDRVWLSNDQTLGSVDTHLRVVNRNVEVPASDPNSDDDSYTVTGVVTVPRPSSLNSPTAPPTDFYLLLRTDDFGNPVSAGPHAVVESDETDNVTAARIRLTPVFPDLAPTAFTAPLAANIPATGARIRVSWAVTNQGPDVARCCWNDRLWLSTDRVLDGGDTHVQFFTRPDDLAARDPTTDDDTYTVTAFVTVPRPIALNTPTPTARYYLLVRTDDNGSPTTVGPHSVVEGDDTNNLAVAPIDLTPIFPDLVTTSVTAPSSAVAGQRIAVRWTVANQGADTARSGWNDRIWLSNDRVLGSGDTHLGFLSQNADVPAGESYDQTLFVTIPAGLATGTYHLFVRADDNGNPADNARATVIESSETNNARSRRLAVGHQPPTANANGPYTVAEGGSVALSGSGGDPDNDLPLSFGWDLDDDGTFETTGQNPTFSAAGLDGPGSRTVVLEVCDSRNACTTASATVDLTNAVPTATLNAPAVDEGTAIALSLTDRADPSPADVAAGLTYAFDCGDGSGYGAFGSASGTTCPTNDNGSRAVGAKIKDKDGGENEYTTTVTIHNAAATATFNAPAGVEEGSAIALSLTGAVDPSSIDTSAGFEFAFDCDDGNGYGAFGAAGSTTCPTTNDGNRTVKGKVRDKDDGATEYTAPVAVANVAPTATLRNNGPVNEGAAATISFANQTDPSSADTAAGFHYAYACDGGSLNGATYGNSGTAASTTCTYPNGPSTQTVRARIIDQNGGFAERTTDVVVNGDQTPPTTPVLTLTETEPDEHVIGTTLFYNPNSASGGTFIVAAATDDPQSDIASVEFPAVFGADGALDTTSPYQHFYTWATGASAAGAKTVTATNGDGGTTTSTFTVVRDTRNPTAAVTAPANNATLPAGRTVQVRITAADVGAGVEQVQLRVCPGNVRRCTAGTVVGSDATAPYQVAWARPAAGTYTLVAEAFDRVGRKGVSAKIVVTVGAARATGGRAAEAADTTGPAVALTAPSAGAALSGRADLAAEAADDGSGVAEVAFQARPAGGTEWVTLGRVTGAPYLRRVDLGRLADGAYVLRAVATDEAGNVAASPSVRVTVASSPPVAPEAATPAPDPAATTEERARRER